ncbi:MAG: glutamate formimidoyltransferase [Planctomycetota bacterium]
MQIVQCVPNFSEGRRSEVIDTIITEITSVPNVMVLGQEMDASHHRSVITFAGSPAGVKEAAFKSVRKASELIDLTKHRGEHPRMGATDVIPFIPLKNITMAECVILAHELGQKIGEQLKIPVFFYEEAATRPERKNLANVRKGGFEGLREEIGRDPARQPDFGPARIHPTAGATAVGARFFLVAYNINLNTDDLQIAKKIARTIRESSGGLPFVKALGIIVEQNGKKIAQVTMNLTNYKITPMKTVLTAIKEETRKSGVEILESELIGLLPADALTGTSPEELLIKNFNPEKQIIENRLENLGM